MNDVCGEYCIRFRHALAALIEIPMLSGEKTASAKIAFQAIITQTAR